MADIQTTQRKRSSRWDIGPNNTITTSKITSNQNSDNKDNKISSSHMNPLILGDCSEYNCNIVDKYVKCSLILEKQIFRTKKEYNDLFFQFLKQQDILENNEFSIQRNQQEILALEKNKKILNNNTENISRFEYNNYIQNLPKKQKISITTNTNPVSQPKSTKSTIPNETKSIILDESKETNPLTSPSSHSQSINKSNTPPPPLPDPIPPFSISQGQIPDSPILPPPPPIPPPPTIDDNKYEEGEIILNQIEDGEILESTSHKY